MRRTSQRAFTLVELLVAVTAGLFVAVGAYALAKQGSRFFQQEARIANAQFSATLGFDRLRADIARAGFLSTANIQKDPLFCSCDTPGCLRTAGWPTAMAALAAVRIVRDTPTTVKDPINGLYPDQISLSGSYSSPETFPVRAVFQTGATYQLYLQNNNGPAARSGGAEGGALGEIFRTGRMLRILDTAGRFELGEIASYSLQAGGEMQVVIKQNPAIPFKRAGGVCGVEGFGVGMQANVVNWIRYEIRDLKASPPPGYAALYGDAATAAGDEGRFDLVRYELNTDGTEMANTVELVAEYAVDLRFSLTVVPSFQGGDGGGPTLAVYKFDEAENYTYGAAVDPASTSDIAPNRIRSVRARLVVRSREADRAADIVDRPTGNIYRFAMGTDGGSFARARTLTADIALPNLARLRW